ncbi:hypothetical protein G6F57_003690 [Rhizopus arrhizus]|uniref:SWR1-complex protein 4 n=1 Tax=Rhizopus oryzae TaxID=64495 RepID=A0A9P7BN20_RHIOR|nr:hypothetical protein G6F23_007108 [Rhizopus arrhizus]KAG1418952.1 hypothetical protein G6F58_004843 [Rhizopus delemar]KAG0762016.1 hypothetical protein G6F24_007128 [Rhizopus arrhizus]KAG0793591.1 hypothetical protein G6F21_003500 [Rhizopus arrhizus]KAG0810418.1 hypothetical protein G6F20_007980 [Rhizopus arrhizus]
MSSSDIRDILQINNSSKEFIQKKPKQTVEKRPDGISRELYQLIGGAPPVAFVKPTFKTKLQNKQKATPWVERPFSNSARSDGLILKHWVKQKYEFAKFNKMIDIIQYTDEDYEKHLTDNDWSKEETDYLFELCRRYDLRFPVIEDRYSFENKQRTMEDLKDRYYSICRKMILQGKGPGTGEYDRQTIAQQYAFDKSKEVERKNALIMLFNRTKEQVEEEEALLVEAKRIELNEIKLAKDRESLLNSLQLEQIQQIPSTPNTPLSANHTNNFSSPGSIGITGGTASMSADTKKKRRLQEEMKKGRKLSSAAEIVEPIPEIKREKLTPGVYVRSQKLPIVKPTMQQKVIKVLEELGIGPRPIMPTAQVCHKFEHLQNSILNMFELKKLVDKTETEHKVKLQKGGIGITAGRKRSSKRPLPKALNIIRPSSSPSFQQDYSSSSTGSSPSEISTISNISTFSINKHTLFNPASLFQNNKNIKSSSVVGVNPHRFLQRPRNYNANQVEDDIDEYDELDSIDGLTDEEDEDDTKIVAKIKNGTIFNGKGEFVNKGSQNNDLWSDEARANRKIADLEIENKTLLLLNATLETKLRQQTLQITELEQKLRIGGGEAPLTPISDKHVEDEDEIVSIYEQEEAETEKSFQRIKSTLDHLIEEAHVALIEQSKQSRRVLQNYEVKEEEYRLSSPTEMKTRPTRRTSDSSSTRSSKPTSIKMSRNSSRQSSPPILQRPSSPSLQRTTSPSIKNTRRSNVPARSSSRLSNTRKQDTEKPKWHF